MRCKREARRSGKEAGCYGKEVRRCETGPKCAHRPLRLSESTVKSPHVAHLFDFFF